LFDGRRRGLIPSTLPGTNPWTNEDQPMSGTGYGAPPTTKSPVFSAPAAAKRVLRLAATGSLGTLARNGSPFVSLVTVATMPTGEPILLLSALAAHTRNLERDRRASLLLVGPGGEDGDPLAGARLTLVGSVSDAEDDPRLSGRFVARHEEAAAYAAFQDFGFRRFVPTGAHLVAGFGRIVDLLPKEFLTDCTGAGELIEAEERAIQHMNEDCGEALRQYATRLLGLADGDWRMTGADPEGIDLRNGSLRGRLDFDEPVTKPDDLSRTLADLARRARAATGVG
jgi:putative heme iron utilization protein